MRTFLYAQRMVLTILFTAVLTACSIANTRILIPTASATALPTSTATRIPPSETAQPTVTPTEMVPPYQEGMQLTKTTALDKDSNGTLILRDTKTGEVIYFVSPKQQWVAVPDQIDRSQVKTIVVLGDGRIVLADEDGQGLVLMDLANKSVVFANDGVFAIGLKTLKLENGGLIEVTPTPTPTLPPGQAYETVLGVDIVINTNTNLDGEQFKVHYSQAATDKEGIHTASVDPAVMDQVLKFILRDIYSRNNLSLTEKVSVLGVRNDNKYPYMTTGGLTSGFLDESKIKVTVVDDQEFQRIKEAADKARLRYADFDIINYGKDPYVIGWFDVDGNFQIVERMGFENQFRSVDTESLKSLILIGNGMAIPYAFMSRGVAMGEGNMLWVDKHLQVYGIFGCTQANKWCLTVGPDKITVN